LYQVAPLWQDTPVMAGFAGKPFSYGGVDTPSNSRAQVLQHRAQLHAALFSQIDEVGPWHCPEQTHGKQVVPTCHSGVYPQTDGLLLLTTLTPVMLLFADCVPIWLYSPRYHVGALVHAGWRGTAQHIVKQAVLALQKTVEGLQPAEIEAWIGPSIGLCCYQTHSSCAQSLADSVGQAPDALSEAGVFRWLSQLPENPWVNLKVLNRLQLEAAGLSTVAVSDACTRCQSGQHYSHRAGDVGRNAGVMMLLPRDAAR
jgi:polyphenol oxidase